MSEYKKAKLTQAAYLRMANLAEESEDGKIYNGKTFMTASQCTNHANDWGIVAEKIKLYEREKDAL